MLELSALWSTIAKALEERIDVLSVAPAFRDTKFTDDSTKMSFYVTCTDGTTLEVCAFVTSEMQPFKDITIAAARQEVQAVVQSYYPDSQMYDVDDFLPSGYGDDETCYDET